MKNGSFGESMRRISERINANVFLLMGYYCVFMALVFWILQMLNIQGEEETVRTVAKPMGMGISLGLLHRYVLWPEGLTVGRRLLLGSVLVVGLGVLYAYLISLV